MSDHMQNPPWHDTIVQELHDIRAKLVEKYKGDMSAYSQAATTHALELGFQFGTGVPRSADDSLDGASPSATRALQANVPQRANRAVNP